MESEVIRIAVQGMTQGMEISYKLLREGAKGVTNLSAFLKAYFDRNLTAFGEQKIKSMLSSGETLLVDWIPKDVYEEFKVHAAEYGFPYCNIDNDENDRIDIMFKQPDLSKYTSLRERVGLPVEHDNISEYNVTDMRSSVKDNLEKKAKAEAKKQPAPAKHRITELETDEIRGIMKDINRNNLDAVTPENWQAYLEVQALLYDYSDGNKKKIADQQPDATLVMSNTRWKAIGRERSDDATGITITMPELVDGKPTGSYTDATVYDVSETVGAEINMDSYFVRIEDDELDSLIETLANSDVKVSVDDALEQDALFDPESNTIRLKKNLDRDQRFKALQRERVYAKCFAAQGEKFSRADNSFLAQSITYALATKFGIDSSEYSFSYLSTTKPGDLVKVKEAVRKEVSQYSKEFKKAIKKVRSMDARER